jgi:hypothetical protein
VQRLKSNYTGTRLTARQNEVARFARDTVRIMADIMAQHFSPQSLVEVSGAMFEEGLGVNVTDVEQKMAMAQSAPAMHPPMPPMMGQNGGQPMGGGPGMMQPPMQPPMPMGPNVVPFQPRPPMPGMPAPGMPMPGVPITAPPVAPGLPPPPPPDPMQIATQEALKRIDAAIGLLRNERLRGFRVDIEVDSTIYGDAAQEKGDRTEFISEVTKYLQTSMAMSAQLPEITPLLGKLLQFGVRGFRVGRDLEAAIEEFCDSSVKLVKQKQLEAQSKPNPEQIKADAQAKAAQATAQSAQVRAQSDSEKAKSDIAVSQMEAQTSQQQAQAEVARQQLENQGEQQNAALNLLVKQMEVRMREMEMQMEKMRLAAEQKQIASDQKIAKSDEKIAATQARAAAARPASGAA